MHAEDNYRQTPWLAAMAEGSGYSMFRGTAAVMSRKGSFPLVERFYQYGGVDVNAQNSDGVTALFLSAYYKDKEMIKRLGDYGADPTILPKNIDKYEQRTVRRMRKLAENWGWRIDESQYAPAVVATEAEQPSGLFQRFIAWVTEPYPEAADFPTVGELVEASRAGDVEKVRELIDKGVDVNGFKDRRNALMAATEGGHAEIVELLIKAEADVDAQYWLGLGINRMSPLHQASMNGDLKIMKLLIDADANVNIRTGTRDTALMLIFIMGNLSGSQKLEVAKVLVEAGANIRIKDGEGRTVVDYAELKGHKSAALFLRNAEAKAMAE